MNDPAQDRNASIFETPEPTPVVADRVAESSEESFPASDAPAFSTPQSAEPLDIVQEASEESFPASDPPSFTPTTHLGPPRH